MNQLTSDLTGVAVYLDDILISGTTVEGYLNNLRQLLKRLNDKGLRCRIEKCVFAEDSITYLGHTISRNGISKGPKADAITKMTAPSNVTQLRSFLGSVQFYNKFLPDLSTISCPLYHLTEKNTKWKWDQPQEDVFKKLKQMLTDNTVLAHFDPSCPVGISCDASDAIPSIHRQYRTSHRECFKDADRYTKAVSTNPEGSSIHHLRTEEVLLILIRKEVHPCDRPQAINFYVWTKYCHTSISS